MCGALYDPGVRRWVSCGNCSLEGLDGVCIGELPPSAGSEVALGNCGSPRVGGSPLFWWAVYEGFDVFVCVVERVY